MRSFLRRARAALVALCLLLGTWEVSRQAQETRYVRETAADVVRRSGAVTQREKVVALRDHLRRGVSFIGAPHEGRPFLRATAEETLRTRKGFCGEVSRAFICLAATQGIRAQRINLIGRQSHVVVEAQLDETDAVLVDCQYPSAIEDLEPLDRVILRPEYSDYSTVNLRRLGLSALVVRLKTRSSLFTLWLENPHAIKAVLWYGLAFLVLLGVGLRRLLRRFLLSRGWVHVSALPAGVGARPPLLPPPAHLSPGPAPTTAG